MTMTATTDRSYCFECVPTPDDGETFAPFLLEFRTHQGDAAAARRAWWAAFHRLGPRGFEPEDFEVYEYSEAFGRGARAASDGWLVDGGANG